MAQDMKLAGLVWNRATMDNHGEPLAVGDIALRSLLRAHGMVMNGGVLHAAEVLSEGEFSGALGGYQYFGLEQVANLLSQGKTLYEAGDRLDEHERRLDKEYEKFVPDDMWLIQQFESRFMACPPDFSPVLSR